MNRKLVERQPPRHSWSPVSRAFDLEPWPDPPCEAAEGLFAALVARVAGPAIVSLDARSTRVPKWRHVHVCPCWSVQRLDPLDQD